MVMSKLNGATDPVLMLDVTTPNPARMYDYFLGGKDNFAADREAAEKALAVVPHGRQVAWANRRFLQRAVEFMVHAGISQFIDLGSGIPTSPNVHEIARAIIPDARVAYVDNDPVACNHAKALLATSDGVTVINGDLRYATAIFSHPSLCELIDFTRPVGVLMVAVLHFVRDAERPGYAVAAFRWRMMPGSMLALSHITSDGTPPGVQAAIEDTYAGASAPAVFRTRAQIAEFFGDLPLVEPGLVEVARWRNPHPQPISTLRFAGGVARNS
jgi:hypothetical protein